MVKLDIDNAIIQRSSSTEIPGGPTVGMVLDEIRRMEGLMPLSSADLASLPPWTDEEADAFERTIFETSEQIEEPIRIP